MTEVIQNEGLALSHAVYGHLKKFKNSQDFVY